MFFKSKVKKSFSCVKKDMKQLRKDHMELKRSANEWIQYLAMENSKLRLQLDILQKEQVIQVQ